MAYINNENEIMVKTKRVTNDTEYLPLCVRGNIILMSDNKLYHFTKSRGGLMLLEFKIATEENYICNIDDFTASFTASFAKINSKYYEIDTKLLHEIPITAKNPSSIIKIYTPSEYQGSYYFVNVYNKLVLYKKTDDSHTILGGNVDFIFFYDNKYSSHNIGIVYNQTNENIVYSIFNNSVLIESHIVDYNGSSVIKTCCKFALDSNGNLYKFDSVDNKYCLTKVLDSIVDFIVYDTVLYIQDHNRMLYKVNSYNYNITYIDNGYFKRKPANVKSAYNLCKS